MEAYQERVVKEREELNTKLMALRDFNNSPTFRMLSNDERARLCRQAMAMTTYLSILNERIQAF